ncbi:MAG: D-2-hydroxyacid dehydrogenase [Clostridiales bacterium]|nr:D-2-hydroxyacid dehydrogenase [Clostridiales bacterium]
MKIVITDASTVTNGDISLKVFEQFGEVAIYDVTEPDQVAQRIKDADAVIVNKTVLNRHNLKDANNLKYIGLFATGYNNIDLEYTNEKGITVCNAPGYSTEAVAQHTFAFILSILNRVGEYNETVKQGDWIKSRTFSYFPLPLSELSQKTIGIVGYGSIGKQVGEIAKAFNMRILVNNRSKVQDETVTQVSFDELLKNSDIVTLHCPLNKDSENIMNEDAFSKMKDGAVFVNTARGGMVDEYALRNALESKKLLGAGLDVLKKEPMDKDCPLFNVPNCYITPHIAWAGVETRTRLLKLVIENIQAFIDGKAQNTVG